MMVCGVESERKGEEGDTGTERKRAGRREQSFHGLLPLLIWQKEREGMETDRQAGREGETFGSSVQTEPPQHRNMEARGHAAPLIETFFSAGKIENLLRAAINRQEFSIFSSQV